MCSGLRSLLFVPGDDERKLSRAAESEVAWACGVLDAFAAAEASRSGVTVFEGRLVDAPVVARARRILACTRSANS